MRTWLIPQRITPRAWSNHPCVGGNKRIGFIVGVSSLELNGYRFAAGEPDAAQDVLELAAGSMNEDGYRDFLRSDVERV